MLEYIDHIVTSSYFKGPLVRLHVEAYLDEHPEFLESYVLRKVKTSTVERWQQQKPLPDNSSIVVNVDDDILENDLEDHQLLSRQGSLRQEGFYAKQVRAYHSAECTPIMQRSFSATPRRRKSAAVTPHRKISMATFEDGCHSPILKQEEDGSMSFLTIPPVNYGKTRDLQAETLHEYNINNDSSGLSNIPDVHDNLTSDLNQSSLCFKIAKNFSIFSGGLSTTVLQVKGVGAKTYFTGSALNVGKQSLNDSSGALLVLTKDIRSYLLETVMRKQSKVVSREELEGKFGTISFLDEKYQSVGMIVLQDVDGNVHGLALISLADTNHNLLDNKLITDIAKLSGICMRNAADFNTMRLELTRSQVFLELARVIFDNQMSIENTVLKMLVNFLELIECERAQLLLSSADEPTTFSKVYDLEDNDLKQENFDLLESPYENRFPINSSIIGLVASLGETVNIGDNSCEISCEDDGHFEHRSLLCMPIKDGDSNIIGVVTLINKKTGIFTCNDESFVEAFGIFCGIALANVSNYEQLKTAEARKQVALDIMTYHATSNHEEAEMLSRMSLAPTFSARLDQFSFTDAELEDIDTLTVSKANKHSKIYDIIGNILQASLKMFEQLDLLTTFNMDQKTICRWLLTVKKNYRPEVVYHNWRHAFNVGQVMFSCIVNSGWWQHLGPVTCLGLLVACLCHDIDHRGM